MQNFFLNEKEIENALDEYYKYYDQLSCEEIEEIIRKNEEANNESIKKTKRKSKTQKFIKNLLSDRKFVFYALLKMYDRQTPSEKESRKTIVNNEQGFSCNDAYKLSSYAETARDLGGMDDKAAKKIAEMLINYPNQILEIAAEINEEELKDIKIEAVKFKKFKERWEKEKEERKRIREEKQKQKALNSLKVEVENEKLFISFEYCEEFIDSIKEIGYKYEPNTKRWFTPIFRYNIEKTLESLDFLSDSLIIQLKNLLDSLPPNPHVITITDKEILVKIPKDWNLNRSLHSLVSTKFDYERLCFVVKKRRDNITKLLNFSYLKETDKSLLTSLL